ncbi:MAG: glycerol-3-phosphate 1-O-acyltransferase PlsY [Candidatus Improbicoccus devescovinae]|nr:MAG: glycerol-3-phosphate 1-O-acyltransferase PlsY [Candidatus Improbicoccus devescovinae]
MIIEFMNFFLKKWLLFGIVLIFAYLLGSLNSSIIISKFIKKDIRNLGSKNAGFTNVLRTMGWKSGILTFVGDFLKGIISIAVGKFIITRISSEFYIWEICSYLILLACLLGHVYPCYFKFNGGKGILTAWAINLIINWKAFLVLISLFLMVLWLTKIVSLSSIAAAIAFPIVTFLFASTENLIKYFITIITLICSIVILLKHSSNIHRLIFGQEKKFNK